MADPDPDSEKRSDPDLGKKTRSETLVPVRFLFFVNFQFLSKISPKKSREDKIVPKKQVKIQKNLF